MHFRKYPFLIGLIAVLFLSHCGDEGGGIKDNFDRSLILNNLADNLIMPAYEDFNSKAGSLNTAAEAFVSAPTVETLTTVKNAWVEAKLSWKYAQIFNFGPVDDLSYETAIDLWPTSAVGIENEVSDYNNSANYLDGVGSNKKGLPAIEYLLFHETETTVVGEFQSSANRGGYLIALVDLLESQSTNVLNAWNNGYKATFVANTGNDVGASATYLANEMILLVELIKNYKVAIPAGITTGGAPLPEKVEAYYARNSRDLILANLDAVKDVFTGGTGSGFDDYLDALALDKNNSEKLSDAIVAQIKACRTTTLLINDPMQDNLESQEEVVSQLFIDLQKLTVLMKTDMMSRLGLIVTFSDNDGD